MAITICLVFRGYGVYRHFQQYFGDMVDGQNREIMGEINICALGC
jgi:hypothetical protein